MEIPSIDLNSAPTANPKIAELAEKAKIEEKAAVNLMEPGQKKKRGRPVGSTKAKVEEKSAPEKQADASNSGQQISSARIAEPFIRVLSKAGAAYAGDARAEMTPQELHDMADALGMVADKWMPMIAKDFGPEFLLASAVSAYGIRIHAIKKANEHEKKSREALQNVDLKKPIADQVKLEGDLPRHSGVYHSPTIGI